MTRKRISPKAGWVSPKRLPRGSHGRAQCRWCGKEVPRGRRTFCSDGCVHEHKIRTNPGYVRKMIFERDRGVCRECGLDTVVEEQRLGLMLVNHRTVDRQAVEQAFRQNLGVRYGARRTAGYWDADHVVPVVQGGGECGLEGYRTLCIPCHKKVTRELRAALARK